MVGENGTVPLDAGKGPLTQRSKQAWVKRNMTYHGIGLASANLSRSYWAESVEGGRIEVVEAV